MMENYTNHFVLPVMVIVGCGMAFLNIDLFNRRLRFYYYFIFYIRLAIIFIQIDVGN